jgi:hypothetical protein
MACTASTLQGHGNRLEGIHEKSSKFIPGDTWSQGK